MNNIGYSSHDNIPSDLSANAISILLPTEYAKLSHPPLK